MDERYRALQERIAYHGGEAREEEEPRAQGSQAAS